MRVLTKLGNVMLLVTSLSPFVLALSLFLVDQLGGSTDTEFFRVFSKVPFVALPLLLLFYVANVFRSGSVDKTQRALWIVLLVFGSYFVFPFFWYVHIWRRGKRSAGEETTKCTRGRETRTNVAHDRKTAAKIALLLVVGIPVVFGVSGILLRMFAQVPDPVAYVLGALAFASLAGVVTAYCLDVHRNTSVKQSQKALWTALLIIGNLPFIPIYWYLNIWRERTEAPQTHLPVP